MIKFLRYFIYYWQGYPSFMRWYEHIPENERKEMEEQDRARGIFPYRNRLDYAYRNSKIQYAHRDRYGRKCKRYGGDCEKCNAKHC